MDTDQPTGSDRRKAALERRRKQMEGATVALEQTLESNLRPGMSRSPSAIEGSLHASIRKGRSSLMLPYTSMATGIGVKRDEEEKKLEGEKTVERIPKVLADELNGPKAIKMTKIEESLEEPLELALKQPLKQPIKQPIKHPPLVKTALPIHVTDTIQTEEHIEVKKATRHIIQEKKGSSEKELEGSIDIEHKQKSRLPSLPSVKLSAKSMSEKLTYSGAPLETPSFGEGRLRAPIPSSAPTTLRQTETPEKVVEVTEKKMRTYEDTITTPSVPIPFIRSTLEEPPRDIKPLRVTSPYGITFKHPPKFKAKSPTILPAVSTYGDLHKKSAAILQSWWRGHMTRTWLSAALVARRLHSGGPTVQEIGRSKTTPVLMPWLGREPEKNKHDPRRSQPHRRIDPWPKTLVRSLCEFLDAVQVPSNGLQPSDLPLLGGDCDSIARVYRYQESAISRQQPFTFTVEKRALRQLKTSREAREALMKKLRNRNNTVECD